MAERCRVSFASSEEVEGRAYLDSRHAAAGRHGPWLRHDFGKSLPSRRYGITTQTCGCRRRASSSAKSRPWSCGCPRAPTEGGRPATAGDQGWF